MAERDSVDIRHVARVFDAEADTYDQRHQNDPARSRRYRMIEGPQLAAVVGLRRVLEIGCGTGRLISQVRGCYRFGIDVSAGMLARAAQKPVKVVRADAHQLPFGAGTFDGILAGDAVFSYLELPRALAECARILRPLGTLVVHLFGPGFERRPGSRELTSLKDIAVLARAAGFSLQRELLWLNLPHFPHVVRVPRLEISVGRFHHAVVVLRLRR